MTNPEKHIALLCNPAPENRSAVEATNNIQILLSGIDIQHKLFIESWPDSFDGFTEVWIVGGDGTINWFINQYPSLQLPFAVFDGGSGNDFQWMLYGNKVVEQQVDQVLQGTTQLVDGGVCNGRLFLNGVGIGFDGAVVHDLLGKKKLAGKASYLLSILKRIIGYHEKPCLLQLPGEKIEQDCFMISVANGRRYGGGFHVAPKALITDGLLDINIVGRISPLKRMKYLPVIEKGAHLDLDFIKYRQANKIVIQSATKLHAHVDGEYIYADSFDIEVLPKRFSLIY
ncbi:MAG: diacylglycerol/lipid kinase family protein [Flavisolibacter sp.]